VTASAALVPSVSSSVAAPIGPTTRVVSPLYSGVCTWAKTKPAAPPRIAAATSSHARRRSLAESGSAPGSAASRGTGVGSCEFFMRR